MQQTSRTLSLAFSIAAATFVINPPVSNTNDWKDNMILQIHADS